MFPNTINITFAPASTPIALNRVNQDNYGSEYRFRDATQSVNMKIRQSTDSIEKDSGLTMLRHNVFLERIMHPTAVDPMRKFTITATIREDQFSSPIDSAGTTTGLLTWLTSGTIISDLIAGGN